MTKKEDEISMIFDLLVDAIPDNVCSMNVLIALNVLATEWDARMTKLMKTGLTEVHIAQVEENKQCL
jgi:hypothetical protein